MSQFGLIQYSGVAAGDDGYTHMRAGGRGSGGAGGARESRGARGTRGTRAAAAGRSARTRRSSRRPRRPPRSSLPLPHTPRYKLWPNFPASAIRPT